ncbi:MAG: ABC transporter permease [Candidatus Thermoplasmatota archaeon]|nr:ABC transporter permease [Candidatus Thermoplasmatota archaeon]MBS3802827.1 ABC transporter permease [Candidatus Thermoplasmatota archaeon]
MNIDELQTYIPSKSVLLIAKKEIMDNIRNKWIIFMTGVFAFLTLIISYFGSFGGGWQSVGLTIAGMMSLVQYLIPIIALMLSYGAVVGEIERGSMSAFLSLPVKRFEIILGKFLGLSSVLAVSIIAGFGIAGIIIGINVGEINIGEYLFFLVSSILLGMVFVCLGLFASSFFKRRSTSMGMAVFLWFFFTMIWSVITIGVASMIVDIGSIATGNIPDWYYAVEMINPLSSYNGLVSVNIESVSNMGQQFIVTYPDFYSTPILTFVLLVWLIVFLALSILVFKKRDL